MLGPTYDLCEGSHPQRRRGQEQGFLARIRLQVTPQRLIGDERPRDQDLGLGRQPARESGEKGSRRRAEDRRQERGNQLPGAEHVHAFKGRRVQEEIAASGRGGGDWILRSGGRKAQMWTSSRCLRGFVEAAARLRLSSGVAWRVKVKLECWRWSHLNSPPLLSQSHDLKDRQHCLDCQGGETDVICHVIPAPAFSTTYVIYNQLQLRDTNMSPPSPPQNVSAAFNHWD